MCIALPGRCTEPEDVCGDDLLVQPLLAGGAPHWVAPQYGATVGAPVDLSVATAPGMGWMCTGVEFWCKESAHGGHGDGLLTECFYLSQPQRRYGDVWGATWLPYYDSWGHNGGWYLEARVHYRRFMPPGQTVTLVVTNVADVLDIVVDATSPAKPPGLPDDALVLAIDPTAQGTPYEHPTIQWQIQTVIPPQALSVFWISVRDAVSGTVVRTVNKADIPNFGLTGEWQWDGSMDGVPPPPEGQLAYGLYTYEVGAAITLDSHRTGSYWLQVWEPWAALGAYNAETEKLPVTLHYGLFADNRPASAAQLYVYDGSKANPQHLTQVGEAIDLATAMGQHELALELDPLDGHPYYLLVYARDDHGDLTVDGDRDHKDRAAQARAVRLTYQVTDVYPEDDGRVYISDTLQLYDDVPFLFEDGRRCQTEDREATIQVLVTVSAEDDIPGNDEQTMNLHCGGATVHFTAEDPDSRTLWDPNGDEQGDDNDGDPGAVDPAAVVAEPKTVRHGGEDVARALAETTLTVTNRNSGDNYLVEASPYDGPVEGYSPVPSGTLEAWKLIYYERDRAYKTGAVLAEPAVQGQFWVTPLGGTEPFHGGQEVRLFDSSCDQDPPHLYHVAGCTTETVQLVENLRRGYPAFDGGIVVVADGFCEAIDTACLEAAFGAGEGFAAFQAYPGEAAGVYPTYDLSENWRAEMRGYFDHKTDANVVHLIDGAYHHNQASGETSPDPTDEVMVFEQNTDPVGWTEPELCPRRSEVLVHELGHVFGMGDLPPVPPWPEHPNHANHAQTDGCMMLYPPTTDWTNGIALFGGPVPVDNVVDLRESVAGHTEPAVPH